MDEWYRGNWTNNGILRVPGDPLSNQPYTIEWAPSGWTFRSPIAVGITWIKQKKTKEDPKNQLMEIEEGSERSAFPLSQGGRSADHPG